jgi:hypothetical protein
MLTPNEFRVGTIGQASGLCLVIPRSKYEQCILLSDALGSRTAVFLDGDYAFRCFTYENNNTAWKGLIVPGVRLEVDEASLFDPEDGSAPLGALIRVEDRLHIVARPDDGFLRRRGLDVCIIADLPAGEKGMAAGFGRWCVVLGEGQAKRELKVMDAMPRKPA